MATMQSTVDRLPEIDLAPLSRPTLPTGVYRLYAIAFDLDTTKLKELYHNASWNNGYADISRILEEEGFNWAQGSVVMADPKANIDAVKTVLAAQRLARELPWFREVVSDFRMFRIEENNDLSLAIAKA